MALSRFNTRAVGTSATALCTAVPAAKNWTIIGLSLCNKTAGSVSVSFWTRDVSSNDTYVLFNFVIPAGETHFPWGQLGKGVMITGDVLYVQSSVAASIDVVMPYYEGT